LLGAGLAWLFFNGHTVATLGGAFAQVVFQVTVTSSLILTGLIWACSIGILGGLFPAVRSARLPVAEALRAT
jgi:putative ABC transport system permease protein